jgi:hypothetical protein
MPTRVPLTPKEISVLAQVRASSRLTAEQRAAAGRLIHLGLIAEAGGGFRLSASGVEALRHELTKVAVMPASSPRYRRG